MTTSKLTELSNFTVRCLLQLLSVGREEKALELLEEQYGVDPVEPCPGKARAPST